MKKTHREKDNFRKGELVLVKSLFYQPFPFLWETSKLPFLGPPQPPRPPLPLFIRVEVPNMVYEE